MEAKSPPMGERVAYQDLRLVILEREASPTIRPSDGLGH
jgi:hypothetical protein